MAQEGHAPNSDSILPEGAEPGHCTGFASRIARNQDLACGPRLDQLAHGKMLEAADVLAQRLKAFELAAEEGGWAQAQYLELIPQDKGTLVSGDERHMLKQGQESALRLNPSNQTGQWNAGSSSRGSWPAPSGGWQGKGYWNSRYPAHAPWKGKGKGQDKGAKGKNKIKGEAAPAAAS